MAFGIYYPKMMEEVLPLVVGSDQSLVENLKIIGNHETHPVTWLPKLN